MERVGDPATLGTLPICGVPCTTGVPRVAVEVCPLPSSASAPKASPYRGDQGGIPLLRSSSFSAVGGGGGVPDACAFGDQVGMLPCAGSLLEGGQVASMVPPFWHPGLRLRCMAPGNYRICRESILYASALPAEAGVFLEVVSAIAAFLHSS